MNSKETLKLDSKTFQARKKLANKIVNEHFAMTLHIDRSINYLWFMYNNGAKKDVFRPFIFEFELNLLLSLGIIDKSQKDNINVMLSSEDADNVFMAILSIDNFRKQRIKTHGEWVTIDVVSQEFRDVVSDYLEKIVSSFKHDGR